jgi:hypothetical protein
LVLSVEVKHSKTDSLSETSVINDHSTLPDVQERQIAHVHSSLEIAYDVYVFEVSIFYEMSLNLAVLLHRVLTVPDI